MDWNDVTAYLNNEGLLLNQHVEISSLDELESIMLGRTYSSEKSPKLKKLVFFDSECIESSDSYTQLFEKFLLAMSNDIKLKLINSNFDRNNQTASISAKKRGKLYEKEWEQCNDWVSEEFLIYIMEVTNNRKEVFFPLDTGDQTLFYICIDKKISNFLKKERSDSEKTGAKYFISQFPSNSPAYIFEYLPRQKYNEITSEFKNLFMHGALYEISSFKTEAVDILNHLDSSFKKEGDVDYVTMSMFESEEIKVTSEKARTIELATKKHMTYSILAEREKQNSPNLKAYALQKTSTVAELVPPLDAYLFTLDPKYGILVETTGTIAFKLYDGCATFETAPALGLMGKDRKWGIISKPSGKEYLYLIYLGSIVEGLKNNELVKFLQ